MKVRNALIQTFEDLGHSREAGAALYDRLVIALSIIGMAILGNIILAIVTWWSDKGSIKSFPEHLQYALYQDVLDHVSTVPSADMYFLQLIVGFGVLKPLRGIVLVLMIAFTCYVAFKVLKFIAYFVKNLVKSEAQQQGTTLK